MRQFIIQNQYGDVVDILIDVSAEEALSLWNSPEGWTATGSELTDKQRNELGQLYSKNLVVRAGL
jgi:hypothetical protein